MFLLSWIGIKASNTFPFEQLPPEMQQSIIHSLPAHEIITTASLVTLQWKAFAERADLCFPTLDLPGLDPSGEAIKHITHFWEQITRLVQQGGLTPRRKQLILLRARVLFERSARWLAKHSSKYPKSYILFPSQILRFCFHKKNGYSFHQMLRVKYCFYRKEGSNFYETLLEEEYAKHHQRESDAGIKKYFSDLGDINSNPFLKSIICDYISFNQDREFLGHLIAHRPHFLADGVLITYICARARVEDDLSFLHFYIESLWQRGSLNEEAERVIEDAVLAENKHDHYAVLDHRERERCPNLNFKKIKKRIDKVKQNGILLKESSKCHVQ